jgi:hypothetical protein
MRNAMILAVTATLVAAGALQAQGRGGMGRFGGGPSLITNESVQTELKLTDEQKTKAGEFAEKFRATMRSVREDNQGEPEKMQAEMAKANTAGMKDLAGFLKDDQMKRFRQINWQVGGLNALATNEELQKTIKLTDEGKEKAKKLAAELRSKTMELLQDGPGPDTQKKMTELRKEYSDKAVESLTADQKKAYKEALGKAFEVKFAPPPGQ